MNNLYIVATEPGEAASLIAFLHLQEAGTTVLAVGPRALAEEGACAAAVNGSTRKMNPLRTLPVKLRVYCRTLPRTL